MIWNLTRILLAASAGLIFALALLVFSLVIGTEAIRPIINSLLPTPAGLPTLSDKTPYAGLYRIYALTGLREFVLILLSLTGGLVVMCLLLQRKLSSRAEQAIAIVGLLGLGSASGANFSVGDSLIRAEVQAAIDYLLAICGITVVGILWRWRTERPLLRAAQLIGIFVTGVFAVALPLYFATDLVLIRLGFFDRGGISRMNPWSAIQYAGTGLSLIAFAIAAGLVAYRSRLRHRAEVIKSAPTKDRLDAITATAEFFRVDVAGLPPEQQREIVLAQIDLRARRQLLTAVVSVVLAILLAITAIAALRT